MRLGGKRRSLRTLPSGPAMGHFGQYHRWHLLICLTGSSLPQHMDVNHHPFRAKRVLPVPDTWAGAGVGVGAGVGDNNEFRIKRMGSKRTKNSFSSQFVVVFAATASRKNSRSRGGVYAD